MWFVVPQFVGFLIFLVAGFAGDRARAVRPARGRRRDRRRLQHRVRRDALRLVLHGRVHGDPRDLRDRAACFLGGWHGPGPIALAPLWMLIKIILGAFFFIWVRASLPRLRYDQLMSFGWKILLPLATLNVLVTAIVLVVT